MKYFFLAIAALTLTACQTQTPTEWKAQRAIEDGADRYCRTTKGKEQFATCYEREVRGRKKFYDGIMARYAHVQPR
ncbi:hypothetical protein G6L41_017365 [Agrobacterium tumefaciens]|uniref:hypothetical protein n=1 Tax=Agrobacterium TaxID=357 RepID=UPI0003744E62|nr:MULTISPECIES: hypothetical protein [Agrobacterium]WCK15395.1 hypothetical protein G6L41_017365 [Agrobacterium tumefaciens]